MFKTRILSVIMAIALVVSCVPAITFGTFADDTAAVYYIQAGATGTGASEDSPAGTMSALVAQIEKDGLNVSGTEVVVKLMNGTGRFAYNSENGAYKVVPYNATLIFERFDDSTTANLWVTNHNTDGKRSDYSYIRLGGPTVMRNISLAWQIAKADWRQHYANGHSWTLENVTFRAYDNSFFTNTNDVMSLGYRGADNAFHVGGGTGGTLYIDDATIENHIWGYLDFAGNKSTEVYDEDVKLVVGPTNFSYGIRLSGGAKATFNKNANIVLNGTTVNGVSISGSVAIAEGHALQIIYNNGATITGTDGATSLTRYDIFVEEGGALDTTADAGVYKVTFPEGKNTAVATDASGNEYTSTGDLLTVGDAGKYNVTFATVEKVPTYYIQGGATGTGASSDSPAGTMSALVAQIEKDGLNVSGTEVVVKLMNSDSTFAYNSESGSYKIVPHNATLVFERYDASTTAHLWITNHNAVRGDGQHLRLGGPVVFRDLSLRAERTHADWVQLYGHGHDLTFENVTFLAKGGELRSSTNSLIAQGVRVNGGLGSDGKGNGGTFTIDAFSITKNMIGRLDLSGYASSGSEIYENDVKLVVGAAALPSLNVGASTATAVQYRKNANIVLNGTTVTNLFSDGSISSMTDGHAFQIIYNNGASVGSEALKNSFNTRYDIFVENTEGAALDTTSAAGTYAVAYPESKPVVYAYAVDASGNYDGTTPVYYTSAETITVGKAGRYEVGFAAAVSDIDVEIVNDYAEFDGWANDEEKGTLTPVAAASNMFDTDVSEIDGAIIYTADITIGENDKAIITANGNAGETDELVKLYDGGLNIAGYTVAGEFANGTYGVKLTAAPASCALFVEVTKPDGTVIRRGNAEMLAGNTSLDSITVKATDENAVANAKAVKAEFTSDDYTVNEEEPVLTGFEENVYNIVTSYNIDAKTTRNFAFTAKKSYLAEGETLVVKYGVKGSDETFTVDAVEKANPTTMYTDIYFLEADIAGLTAGTTYEYTIGKKDSEEASDWSKTYSFTTEAQDEEGFSFIAIADTQGEAWGGRGFMYAQAAINEALEDVKNPAFILNAGDVVEGRSSAVASDANIETMWEQYFKAMGDTVKSIPHFAAMGNHDFMGHSSDANYLFNLHFNHPDNGSIANWSLDNYFTVLKKNKAESSYSFDYDNAHFVVVNTGVTTDQYKDGSGNWQDPSSFWYLGTQSWLKEDLEASDAEWKIVVAHIPAYDSKGPTGNWTKHQMNTYFEQLGVDLVIEGHAHYNTRTYPMKNGEAVRTDGNPDVITKGEGTVYSVIGSTTTNHDALKDNLNENYVSVFSPASEMPVYAIVDVADDTLTYTVKQLDGFVVDKFTIEKDTSYRTPEKLGVQIRIPTDENTNIKQGLRFVSSIPREVYDELAAKAMLPKTANDTGIGFGSVIIPKKYIPEGEELTKETYDAAIVPAVSIMELGEEDVIFTVCLVDILEENYTRDYCVVPYVTVKNGDEVVTYYGEMQTANVYDIALLACGEDSQESEYTKEYLKEKVIDVVEAANK